MRKLILLATAAMAAMAMMAATAAPASADRDFIVTDAAGNPCNDPCHDTGFEGQVTIRSTQGVLLTTCDASFDAIVGLEGDFETYNTSIHNCSGISVIACDGTGASGLDNWSGQVRMPDTLPPEIDMTVCYRGSSGSDMHYDVTFEVTDINGVRTWTQISDSTTPYPHLADWSFESAYADDDVKIVLL